MSTFKVGDKVRCIKSYFDQIIAGHVYTVMQPHEGYENKREFVFVKREDYTNKSGGYYATSFELVSPSNSYTVHNETNGLDHYGSFFTINEATEYIQEHGIAGHTYTVQEHIERRRFEVVEKVQRELKAI